MAEGLDECTSSVQKQIRSTNQQLSHEESMDLSQEAESASIRRVYQKQSQLQATTSGPQVHTNGCGEPAPVFASRKRGRFDEEEETEVEKRGCEEGMSWWTCLMLGMNQEHSRPQVVKKIYNQQDK